MGFFNKKHTTKNIMDLIQSEAKRRGYEFIETQINSMPWIKYDLCFELSGYVPNYDIQADYGNRYPHDVYNIVNDIISAIYGKPNHIHTPDMDKTHDSYYGTSYNLWYAGKFEIKNFMYGHPRDGYFNTYLYINNSNY